MEGTNLLMINIIFLIVVISFVSGEYIWLLFIIMKFDELYIDC